MPVVRTLEEDFLDSPEKFGALISFYGVLLRKLKEEATGIEILHHITTLDPDLYKMMRVEESPKISPSMAKYIIKTLKRRALKAGTKPLNIFANEKKTRYKTRHKEIIEFLERLYKYAIKTRRECRAEFYRSKIRSLKRLKESKKIEEGRKEEEEKVENGKKLERIKRGFESEDLLKQELKKHLNDKENEEIKSTIETYIRWLVFKKIWQIGVYPPDLHQIEKRIRNDFLIPDSIPIFFKEEIKQKTERSHYDILLVEDDEATIRLLMAYFESQGVTCQGVDNGTKAFEELENNTPKLILTDIIHPGPSGYDICKEIKSNPKLKNIPVFYCTAISGSEVEKNLAETKADGYVLKPFAFSDFNGILDLLSSNSVK